jgi:hypothetical protein
VGLRPPPSSSHRWLAHRHAVPGKGARHYDRRAGLDDGFPRYNGATDDDRHASLDDGFPRYNGATDDDDRASLRATDDGSPGHKSPDERAYDHHGSDGCQLAALATHGSVPFDSSSVFANADRHCHHHEQRQARDHVRRRPSGRRLQRSVEHLHDDAGTRAELQRATPVLPICSGPLLEHAGGHRPRRRHRIAGAGEQHIGWDRDLSPDESI